MKGPAIRRSITALVFLAAPCSIHAAPPDRLEQAIDRILSRPELRTSTVGIHVANASTGEVVFDRGGDKLLAPASNVKLVSCAGALAVLGKDFRFETKVVAAGAVGGGVLDGDVVLVASGDPNLSQRVTADGRLAFADKDHSYAGFFDAALVPGDPLAVLRELARGVKESGVKEVLGGAAVDDGLFSETEDDFAGPFSAACVNDGIVDVVIRPGEASGAPAVVEHQPKGSLVEVTSLVRTAPEGAETSISVESREGVAAFEVTGSIALGAAPVVRFAAPRDPGFVAAGLFLDCLRDAGVTVRGKAKRLRLGPAVYGSLPVLARHVSPPFSEALRVCLKVSQNLHATMLPPLIGALKGSQGDRFAGYRVIRQAFATGGLDPDQVVLWSGSGGGRGDHVSPRWLCELLRFVSKRDDFPVFLDSLPVGGVDGTLADAFRGDAFGRRVHAKTGTLLYRGALGERWVYVSKSLSGYLDLRRNPESPLPEVNAADNALVFSIIIANTLVESRKKGAEDLFHAQEDILRAVFGHITASEKGP